MAYSERHTLKYNIHSPIKTSTETWLAGNDINILGRTAFSYDAQYCANKGVLSNRHL